MAATPANILIAEDDRKQAELLRRYLEREGHRTAVVHDGRAALDEARRRSLDLLLLDLMLPRMDGLDVCRAVRSERDTPIVMLTARADEDDLLHGLDLGADDYITKPYSPRELVARVRTVLRRVARPPVPAAVEQHRVGPLTVDTARREVRVDGECVPTTPAEFGILACLAASPGRPFTRQALLDHASEGAEGGSGRTIDVHVLNLRRKIEPVPTRPRFLLTVYGVGYRLADPATEPVGGGAAGSTGSAGGVGGGAGEAAAG